MTFLQDLSISLTHRKEHFMYFEGIEENQTRLLIVNSLLELLEKRDYSSITINMIVDCANLGRRTFYRYFKTKDDTMEYITKLLMEQFANTIINNHASSMESVTISYFQFWEQYINILLLLKKAHVLYFIEENFESHIISVAKKVKHIPDNISMDMSNELYAKYNYEFSIKLAVFWKATILWCEETPRKTPEEMANLITDLFS